jgi:hypothetical protein
MFCQKASRETARAAAEFENSRRLAETCMSEKIIQHTNFIENLRVLFLSESVAESVSLGRVQNQFYALFMFVIAPSSRHKAQRLFAVTLYAVVMR